MWSYHKSGDSHLDYIEQSHRCRGAMVMEKFIINLDSDYDSDYDSDSEIDCNDDHEGDSGDDRDGECHRKGSEILGEMKVSNDCPQQLSAIEEVSCTDLKTGDPTEESSKATSTIGSLTAQLEAARESKINCLRIYLRSGKKQGHEELKAKSKTMLACENSIIHYLYNSAVSLRDVEALIPTFNENVRIAQKLVTNIGWYYSKGDMSEHELESILIHLLTRGDPEGEIFDSAKESIDKFRSQRQGNIVMRKQRKRQMKATKSQTVDRGNRSCQSISHHRDNTVHRHPQRFIETEKVSVVNSLPRYEPCATAIDQCVKPVVKPPPACRNSIAGQLSTENDIKKLPSVNVRSRGNYDHLFKRKKKDIIVVRVPKTSSVQRKELAPIG